MSDGRRRARRVLTIIVAVLGAAGAVSAQPVEVPDTWGGDLLSRPRLTGSWGGLRDQLGEKGVVLDVDLLATGLDVFAGGINNEEKIWANLEYTLNVDTGKLGLWPGGFLKVMGQTGFGQSLLPDTGALVPVDTALLVPRPIEDDTALMHATFTQFVSEHLGFFVGKVYTFDGFQSEFTGNYRSQFLNIGLAFPMAAGLVPISAYGGGLVALPWEGAILSGMVLDPAGSPDEDEIDEAFDDGATLVATLRQKIEPFGRVGHQTVGGTWSSANRLSLVQDPSNIVTLLAQENFPWLQDPGPILTRLIARFFPGLLVPAEDPNEEDDTWAFFYTFDQYLWHPEGEKDRGVGVFFSFGVSDGKANPVEYSYTAGIGGNGPLDSRPDDSFGFGWARTEFSDDLAPFLRSSLSLGLDREDAFELYYNVAVTSWLNVSFDLQLIHTALEKKLDDVGLESLDPALVGGIRTFVRF